MLVLVESMLVILFFPFRCLVGNSDITADCEATRREHEKKAARLEHAARVTIRRCPGTAGYYRWQWLVRILGEAVCLVNIIIRPWPSCAAGIKIPPPELYLLWAVPKPSSGGVLPHAQLHVQGMHVCNLTRHIRKSCNSSRVTRNHRPSRDFALIILRSILRVRLSAPATSIGTHISLSRL